ncbi:hypothetical protein PAHAL_9G222500 [Panicum hallii]|uniref:Uncharacterized protein n=1 Tax=Panicum hallii TaxID=206008 RepID=A0A2T8I231_9POAL|nr:hypothetical protein PAHAL_9G222500 [Panicum hallii]
MHREYRAIMRITGQALCCMSYGIRLEDDQWIYLSTCCTFLIQRYTSCTFLILISIIDLL